GDRMRNHAAHLVRNALDLAFFDHHVDGVLNLLDALLLHHAGRGVAVRDLVVRAFLEGTARTLAAKRFALVIDVGAASTAGDVAADRFPLDRGHHLGGRIRNLLASDGAFTEAAAGAFAFVGSARAIDIGAANSAANA